MWRASVVLAFDAAVKGDVFLPDFLRKEKDTLVECISALTTKWNRISEELTGVSGLLLEMWNEIRFFWYPHLLAEKVQSLALEINDKDDAMKSSQISLSKTKVAFFEATVALDFFYKKVKELEMSLNKSWEGY